MTCLGFTYKGSIGFIWMGYAAINIPVLVTALLLIASSIIMGAWMCKSIKAYYSHDGDMSNLFSAIIAIVYIVFALNMASVLIALRSYQSLNILIGISKLLLAYFFTANVLKVSTYYTSIRIRHLCHALSILFLLSSIAFLFSTLYVWGGALSICPTIGMTNNYMMMLVMPLVLNIKDFMPNIYLAIGEFSMYLIGFLYACNGKLDIRYKITSLLLIISSIFLGYCAVKYSLFNIYTDTWKIGSVYFAPDVVQRTADMFLSVREVAMYVTGQVFLFGSLFYNAIFNSKSRMSVDYIEYELKKQQRNASKKGNSVVSLKVGRDSV
jgi:hypothetical protein